MFDYLVEKIGSTIIGIGLAVGSFFGLYNETPQQVGGTFQTPEVRALFETTLAEKITSSATSMTLTSAVDIDGTTFASSTYAFIIDEGTANEEIVTADCTGTTCTNLTRGISGRTGTTTVASLQKEHRRGASVKITDAPSLLFITNVFKGRQNIENPLIYTSNVTISTSTKQLVDSNFVGGFSNVASTSAYYTVMNTDNTFTGSNTFSDVTTFSGTSTFSNGAEWSQVCSDGQDLCNKTYVDSVAVAGASDANTTTKGIVEEATVAEINSASNTGGTGAKLFMTPASFAVSNFASTSITTGFSSSTSAYLITPAFNVSANNIVQIWSRGSSSSCNTNQTNVLKIKQSTHAASTTLDSFTANNGSANPCSTSLMGYFTATTTETVRFDLTTGDATYGAIMVQIIE